MARDHRPKPLYRKVNTRTHGVRHGCDRMAGRARNSKAARKDEGRQQGMRQGVRHGLDYTPLYRFLVSRVGQAWDAVYSEAVARLDHEAPIWHLAARGGGPRAPKVRTGASTWFSGLYVDPDGMLAKVDPRLDAARLRPDCACCTHTFDGVPFGLPYDESNGA